MKAGPCLVFALLLASGPPTAACGYHGNPAVGALNIAYPNALWVRTAVWQAQIEGLLERDTTEPPANPVARRMALAQRYRAVTRQLAGLSDHLASLPSTAPLPAFSVLLMGPMLWSRFEPGHGPTTLQVHADGPRSGDVVLLTDEPVLAALAGGRLRLGRAIELGVVRLYGSQASIVAVSQAIDAWRPAPASRPAVRQRS